MGNKHSKIGDYKVDTKAVLGDGSFGDVFVGYVKATKKKIAVKKCVMRSQDGMAVATEEIKTMEHIPRHKNVVEFFDFHFHDDAAWVFMEYCDLGHLGQVMSEHITGTDDKIDVMLQCTQGLHYLHTLEQPIVHRDLKPQNVLFCKTDGKLVAKLADFGLSKIMYIDTFLKTVAGTALYMAPEIITSKYYTICVDIFSLGLLFLAMVLFDSVGQLLPISASSLRDNKAIPVGREMISAASKRRPMPIVAAHSVSDQHQIKVVKRLINKMVMYEPEQRLPLRKVELELKEILCMEQSEQDSGKGFSLHSTVSGAEGGRSILERAMRQALVDAETSESDDSMVVDALSTLSKGLHITDTLDSLLHNHSMKFKLGERVLVDSDKQRVQPLQKKTCGWVKQMQLYLGKDGWIYDIHGHDVYTVKFGDGYRFSFCGSILQKYDGQPITLHCDRVKFKVGEMVTVISDSKKLQTIQQSVQECDRKIHLTRGSGGVVQKITTEGLCVVECFNGDVWKFHPDVLVSRKVAKVKLGVGDIVFISPSRNFIKMEMKSCGLVWITEIEKCLDSSGTVLELTSSGTAKVKTEGLRVELPTSVLTHYGRKSEIEKARLVKAVVEEAVKTVKSKK